ncbi:hypothetical protein [Streptomyces tsukubensis]|uniref:hypothetical protein n=1 Tax=Streptomyces tsukubensis TaxID=83656 RepID=UPI00344F9ABE
MTSKDRSTREFWVEAAARNMASARYMNCGEQAFKKYQKDTAKSGYQFFLEQLQLQWPDHWDTPAKAKESREEIVRRSHEVYQEIAEHYRRAVKAV